MVPGGAIAAMAKLGCATPLHYQTLHPNPKCRPRMMTQKWRGLQQQLGCSSRTQVKTVTAIVKIKPGRLEIGRQTRVPRRNLVSASPCSSGEIGGTAKQDLLARERLSCLADKVGNEFVSNQNASVRERGWRFGVDNLIQGHVGWYAFLGTLLLGVGVSCVMGIGEAEAATSHMHGHGDVDMRALAMGPEGPLVEEFWDNMRRYGLYFLTVVSGGVYTLVKPAIDALKNPVTAVLVIVVVTGSLYLVALTVSAMLGINEFQYDYGI